MMHNLKPNMLKKAKLLQYL